MSSGLKKITITEVVQQSDAILLVSKRTPYHIERSFKLSDSLKEEFKCNLYSFEIKSVINTSVDALNKMKTIEVHSASDEDDITGLKYFLEGGPNRIRIHRYYDSGNKDVDNAGEFVIFIRYNELNGWYSFTAGGAMESKKALELRKGWYPPGPANKDPE